MHRRFIGRAAGSCLAVVLFATPYAHAAALNLRDVPAGDPDRTSIAFLSQHEVIYGYPDGTFHPDANITRGEILKIALEASGEGHAAFLTDTSGGGRFSDVPASYTLSSYIAYATDQAYISGYPDGMFHPDAQVTRAEAAKIMGKILHAPGAHDTSPYRDLAGSSLAPFVNDLYAANWFRPAPPLFNPNIPATRREVARMAYRGLVAQAAAPGEPYAESMPEPPAIASDWQVGAENNLSVAYPAGWVIGSDSNDVGGATLVATGVAPKDDTENPAFGLIVGNIADLEALQQEQSEGQFTDPITRQVAVDGLDGARTIRVMEFRELSQGIQADVWVSGDKVYIAMYFERDWPGLSGTFDRFMQHAIDLNGAAA